MGAAGRGNPATPAVGLYENNPVQPLFCNHHGQRMSHS